MKNIRVFLAVGVLNFNVVRERALPPGEEGEGGGGVKQGAVGVKRVCRLG